MSAPVYTWRDAGLHSRPLRALNAVGRMAASLGLGTTSLAPEALLEAASRKTGLDDFGDDTYGEPLRVLQASIDAEAGLTTFGRIAIRGLLVGALENRLRVRDWAKRHPEVREQRIERPWVILGLPRTGTSLLSILMGLDPEARPLVSWEAAEPVPPPDLATRDVDPRIESNEKRMGGITKLNPPLQAMHPFGATLATECVTLTIFDLRSLSIETQGLMPSYGRWLEQTDMRSAYAWHQTSLQILQSRIPTGAWVLKTPNHLWCLDALLERYPDARIVWTHRDPARVVPSVASLNTSMHRTFSDRVDPVAVGAEWNRKLHLAVGRGMEFDARQEDPSWCCHVQYADFMKDPVGTVERIHAHFGDATGSLHGRLMREWMRERPQDAFGRHAYQAADFDLSIDALTEQYRTYRERYGIPGEA